VPLAVDTRDRAKELEGRDMSAFAILAVSNAFVTLPDPLPGREKPLTS
jgi:hypothetical protein